MNDSQPVSKDSFRRILSRNISFPLGLGALSAVLFLVMIVYLLSILNWVEHSERVIGNVSQVARLSSEMESGMRGYLVTGEESFLQPYEAALSRFDSGVAVLSATVSDNPVQVAQIKRIIGLQQQWDEFAKESIALRQGNLDYVALARTGRGERLKEKIRQEIDAFIAMEQRLLLQRNEEARSTTFWSVPAYLLFTLGVSGLLAFRGRRELLGLSVSYDDVLKQQACHAAQLQQQAWLRSGQTRLAEKMLGQPDLARLGHSALQFLSHYMDSPVAALYSRGDDGRLTRVAAHGFTPGSEQVEQTFYTAQGLVGQAALENRILQLDDVPPDYLKITSGLGQSAPRHVLVVPLHHDAQVTGVVEMAFFRELQPRDLELVELIAHTIGAALHGAVHRQRLQDVLAETQQLNEELQTQQEELRTANEELQEQSNILSKSQATLENQQAELEQTNEQLAEQALSLDHKNAALRQAQVELEARAGELTRASRYKSEFLANMSHELRTPLNSSLILARLLSENPKGNLTDEQVRFAQAIHSAGNDLLNLINDILDISKVEAGKLELVPEQVTLAALVDALKTSFEPLAGQKKLGFEVRIAPGTPASLLTDRQRVEQILKNLLSNAVKFTESGTVCLLVAAENGGGVTLAVQDSGIGIRQDQQDIIFEAFRQADGTTSRRYGGTGLGLSISRDLSLLLGGSISVQSVPGKGSTFTLHLPAALPALLDEPATTAQPSFGPAGLATDQAANLPVPAQPALPAFADDRFMTTGKGRVVLVIEDDAVFARILYDLAHELGFHCLVAHSGEDGFMLAGQFKPDAVLLDMGLPDRSGLSVLQRLKETPKTRHIPVHVVSGQDHREAALLLGAVGYAIKPSSREQLKEVFTTLEHKLMQKLKRVLLVEDDELQRESVMQLIAGDEVDITAVQTGAEALALLAGTVFDCMIVDLKLPDMQGNELLRRMSTGDICSFPPVIVYTGRSLSRAEEADLLKYSRSIIIKGAHSPERLLDEVTLFLHKVESSLSAEQQKLLKTARSRDEVFEGRKILLVDDDVRNIFSLTSALEQKGFMVEIGRNGFEALARLDEVPGIELVLMDVMMPGMDGLEAMRRIRQNPRLQKLPIIAVTAKAMKDDQEQCLAAGANDYLAKPIDLNRLFSLLRVWMPVARRA